MAKSTKVAEEVKEEIVEEVKEETTEEVVEETTEETTEEEDISQVIEEEEPPPKQTAQERINEITRARREAERDAEYWKSIAISKEPEKPQKEPSGRPNIADYESTVEYEDALLDWYETRRTNADMLARDKESKDAALRIFNERATPMRKTLEDFDEVIESPVFTDTMRAVIIGAETGPELAYYLGKNKEVAKRIALLPASMQPYEIGKLETQIEIARKTKKVTGAPPPIKEIGSETGGGEKDQSKLPINEWMEVEKQKEMDKLKQKYGEP